MNNYITQTMSAENTIEITYYKKQNYDHLNDTESFLFTHVAKDNYASFNNLEIDDVQIGALKICQHVPNTGKIREV